MIFYSPSRLRLRRAPGRTRGFSPSRGPHKQKRTVIMTARLYCLASPQGLEASPPRQGSKEIFFYSPSRLRLRRAPGRTRGFSPSRGPHKQKRTVIMTARLYCLASPQGLEASPPRQGSKEIFFYSPSRLRLRRAPGRTRGFSPSRGPHKQKRAVIMTARLYCLASPQGFEPWSPP